VIRLLLDMGLPRRSADDLSALGWDTIHIGAIGRATASDAEILTIAAEQQRVAVTLDADFSRLLALGALSRPSVIFLRLSNLDRTATTALLRTILPTLTASLDLGALAVVTERNVRLRRLPLLAPPQPTPSA
jgi:predicted nuclease of predicted toxin-antitoxin system